MSVSYNIVLSRSIISSNQVDILNRLPTLYDLEYLFLILRIGILNYTCIKCEYSIGITGIIFQNP